MVSDPRPASRHGVLSHSREHDPDVVVVGAGFGGLAAALRLAELGADVLVCETLRYPGGCASTFTRSGYEFEAGATLFSGLGEGQLFARWNDRWDLGLRFDPLDPMVELRTARWNLDISSNRQTFLERFESLPHAEPEKVRAFFGTQRRVAAALWELFDDPSLLPPLSAAAVLRHLWRSTRYASVIRWMGHSLGNVVARHDLQGWEPLRIYLDAVTQITVQANAAEAEAPFAMAAIDYFFRGTGHVRGGIGSLAWGLVEAIRRAGGRVAFSNRVRALTRQGNHWNVETRRGTFRAGAVVANVLPQSLTKLADGDVEATLDDIKSSVESGWGAAMLYMAVGPEACSGAGAHHLQLIDDDRAPFMEGNHVFCSIGAAGEKQAPDGARTMTVSTHVPMSKLLALDENDRAEYVAGVQSAMRQTIARRAPRLREHATFEMTASPRTFARFTGRHAGYVGGIPRRVGLHHYRPRALWPTQAGRRLFMVGDSVLLGQSTLAVALGGVRTAERIASSMD